MPIEMSLNDLIHYTDWERLRWKQWLRQHGNMQVLQISAGPHGDGRFETVGDVLRHMFAAEKRYVEWLSGRPLTDPQSIPANDADALFRFGQRSREELKKFIETFPAHDWDTERELTLPHLDLFINATPRKFVVHIVMHEIRHWAQIATLFRLNGLKIELHDFLASPVMGGGFRHGARTG